MRKNEYNSIDEFKKQYIGIWAPSDGHWYGLDFIYNQTEYRLQTGKMYSDEKDAMFGLYRKRVASEYGNNDYILLAQFDDMNTLLDSSVIDNRKFSEIIIDDNTELVGQD